MPYRSHRHTGVGGSLIDDNEDGDVPREDREDPAELREPEEKHVDDDADEADEGDEHGDDGYGSNSSTMRDPAKRLVRSSTVGAKSASRIWRDA